VCLTGKDHFIEFCKHSGMVNTKFKFLILPLEFLWKCEKVYIAF
jgi:hypothetical protein